LFFVALLQSSPGLAGGHGQSRLERGVGAGGSLLYRLAYSRNCHGRGRSSLVRTPQTPGRRNHL